MAISAYVDTSVLVAILLEERNFRAVPKTLGRFEQLFSSNLLESELLSALERERVDLRIADETLDWLSWILPDRPLSQEHRRVLAKGRPRGADLWHLSCALYLSPTPEELQFVTLDSEQKRIARALGFRV